MRIVTLLPSATEIVCALGLREQLVGVSHSCNFPPDVASLPRITSTRVPVQSDSEAIDSFVREHLGENEALYDLDLEALRRVAPDVIVSQTLCDVCAVSTGDVFDALRGLPSKPELIDLTPNTLADVLDDCLRVGKALGDGDEARRLVHSLNSRLDAIAGRTAAIPDSDRPRVAFLEWLLPPFNGGHWNPELVSRAGGIDLLGAHSKSSSTLEWDTILAAEPEVLVIACCGLRTERALQDVRLVANLPEWQQLPAVQDQRVYVMDGNDHFSCPSPRLVDALEILAHALHPDVQPNLHPASAPHTFPAICPHPYYGTSAQRRVK